MRLVVSGGRNYNDKPRIYDILDELLSEYPIEILNHGGANGVDTICGQWAIDRNIKVIVHHAKWDNLTDGRVRIAVNKYGKKYNTLAGPNRNISMLKTSKPDLVICFPGGRGTKHMLKNAIKYGVETWDVKKNIGYEIHNYNDDLRQPLTFL